MISNDTGFASLFRMPEEFDSRRTTHRQTVDPGQTIRLMDVRTPGCIRHLWMTGMKGHFSKPPGRTLHIRMTADGSPRPDVDMPLDVFFGVLLGAEWYRLESAFLKILPRNGLNCYLPMPFSRSFVCELENTGTEPAGIFFMADWHEYDHAEDVSSLRFRAAFREEKPAESFGSYLLVDVEGSGYVAGVVKGIRPLEKGDAWYHTGGDTWLIDGETHPHALRGVGVEDPFGFSFGVKECCSEWTGVPYLTKEPPGPDPSQVSEVVLYRFFGSDPVRFESSLVLRFGSRANDVESVVYYYDDVRVAPQITRAELDWTLAGPFACNNRQDFEMQEFPERPLSQWPARIEATFGQYVSEGTITRFSSRVVEAEHGWVDFARYYRGRGRTNAGTQPCNVSAYAVCEFHCPESTSHRIRVGFDDWLKLWVDSQLVLDGCHEHGFETMTTDPLALEPGDHRILVKLSNVDNEEWRLWAFCLSVV